MFVGNKKILKLASIISNDIKHGKHENILITGKSGYGKTTLAIYIAARAFVEFDLCYGFNAKINPEFPVTIVDEIHTIKSYETLFRLMDEKKSTLIFTTTELGDLPEPFINRCFIINIPEYDRKQLLEIAKYHNNGYFNNDILEEIVNRCRDTPRIIRNIIRRLKSYFLYEPVKITVNEAKKALDFLGYYENGFTDDDLRYLNALKSHGNLALSSLVKILGLPKDTIENNIETFLLKRGLIKITNKGRSLV